MTALKRREWISRVLLVYGVAGIIALLTWGLTVHFLGANEVAAILIGGGVGCVELLGRYRHAPFRAVFTINGLVYIFVNAGASWAAYYMLVVFKVFDDLTTAKELTRVLTAGIGALVFMRSSVFKVRVGDSDIGIGPAAILDTLLLIADRGVDRHEAVARAQDVTALMANVKDPRIVAKMLTKYSLALMQNVDEKTSQELGDAITKIMTDSDVPDQIKIDIVALRLGIVVGPDVLEATVAALGDRLRTTSDLPAAGGATPAQGAAGPAASSGAQPAPGAPAAAASSAPAAAIQPNAQSGATNAPPLSPGAAQPSASQSSVATVTPSFADLKAELERDKQMKAEGGAPSVPQTDTSRLSGNEIPPVTETDQNPPP